jgi:hypothetical protein
MPHGLSMHPVRLLACAMVLGGCASGVANSPPNQHPTPRARNDSTAIGLVGLLVEKPWVRGPRAPGMTGAIVGYVVSHPALPTDLFVPGGRDGHPLPVLAFKLTFVIAKAEGRQGIGPEEIRGHGTLNVFYKPEGFTSAVLYNAGTFDNAQQIESDHIEFYANPDSGSDRLYRHLQETAIATHAFEFAGRTWRTPASRTASDLLIGQYSDSFVGEAYVSSGAMQASSPEESLIALAGAPHRGVHY